MKKKLVNFVKKEICTYRRRKQEFYSQLCFAEDGLDRKRNGSVLLLHCALLDLEALLLLIPNNKILDDYINFITLKFTSIIH